MTAGGESLSASTAQLAVSYVGVDLVLGCEQKYRGDRWINKGVDSSKGDGWWQGWVTIISMSVHTGKSGFGGHSR